MRVRGRAGAAHGWRGLPRVLVAGAVVWRAVRGAPRFLLLRNVKGHWDFPKGHVEPGESHEQAARREAREEAGLSGLRLAPGFRKLLFWPVREGGRRKLKVADYRLARTTSSRVRLSREHRAARWVDYRQGRSLLSFPNQRVLLQAAAIAAFRALGRSLMTEAIRERARVRAKAGGRRRG